MLLDNDSWTMRARTCAVFKPSMESVLELIIDTKARIEGRQKRALTVEECSVRNVGCIRYSMVTLVITRDLKGFCRSCCGWAGSCFQASDVHDQND